jgi:hypothetical protein
MFWFNRGTWESVSYWKIADAIIKLNKIGNIKIYNKIFTTLIISFDLNSTTYSFLENIFHYHLYNKQQQVFSRVGFCFIDYVMMNFLSMNTLNDDIA